jgi:hypothetical protein
MLYTLRPFTCPASKFAPNGESHPEAPTFKHALYTILTLCPPYSTLSNILVPLSFSGIDFTFLAKSVVRVLQPLAFHIISFFVTSKSFEERKEKGGTHEGNRLLSEISFSVFQRILRSLFKLSKKNATKEMYPLYT